jgi:hypothetical protein
MKNRENIVIAIIIIVASILAIWSFFVCKNDWKRSRERFITHCTVLKKYETRGRYSQLYLVVKSDRGIHDVDVDVATFTMNDEGDKISLSLNRNQLGIYDGMNGLVVSLIGTYLVVYILFAFSCLCMFIGFLYNEFIKVK